MLQDVDCQPLLFTLKNCEVTMEQSKAYIEQTMMNIMKYLEKRTGLCQLKNDVKLPAEKQAIAIWEQKNTLLLPEDLKNFYLTTNGFDLTWSVKMEKMSVSVGKMHINSITSLVKIESVSAEGTHVQPSLWDLDMEEDGESGDRRLPSFVDSKIYELDPCDGYGKVCLVYQELKPGDPSSDSSTDGEEELTFACDYVTEIWFLDRSLNWHFICDSFLSYYRLTLMHLGLPHWQYAFTDMGLPPQSKQWFNVYAPIRLEVDIEGDIDPHHHDNVAGKTLSSPLDLNKIFKGKSDRKKTAVGPNSGPNPTTAAANANTKRKFPVSSARSSTSLGKTVGPANSQMAVKANKM